MKELIQLAGINKAYGAQSWGQKATKVQALADIDLTIHRGEILAILGESGSGKSTLARILTRLERADSGSLLLDGQPLLGAGTSQTERKAYGARVQMIFQDPFASLNPVHTVAYHVQRSIKLHQPQVKDPRGVEARVIELLETVGLQPGAHYLGKYPFELSGGQRQRVAIARALAVEPELLIADEPTSMLDVSIRMDILNLLKDLRDRRNLTIVLITHDLPSAWYLSDRVAVFYGGRIVETGPTAEILAQPAHPYTRLLLQVAQHKILRTRTNVLAASAGGCAFAPRCDSASTSCQREVPTLRALREGRTVRCFNPHSTSEKEHYDA